MKYPFGYRLSGNPSPPPPPRDGEGEQDRGFLSAPPLRFGEGAGGRGDLNSAPSPQRAATGGTIVVLVVIIIIIVIVFVFVLVLLVIGQEAALGLADLVRQFLRLGGPHQRLLLLDQAVLPQLEQAFVEQEHAVLAAGLDAGVDAVRFVLADQV